MTVCMKSESVINLVPAKQICDAKSFVWMGHEFIIRGYKWFQLLNCREVKLFYYVILQELDEFSADY